MTLGHYPPPHRVLRIARSWPIYVLLLLIVFVSSSEARRASSSYSSRRPPARRPVVVEPFDDDDDDAASEYYDDDDDVEEEMMPRPRKPSRASRKRAPRGPPPSSKRRKQPRPTRSEFMEEEEEEDEGGAFGYNDDDDDEEEEEEEPIRKRPPPRRPRNPPPRRSGRPPSRRRNPRGRMVPYQHPPPTTNPLASITSSIAKVLPDPSTVKQAAVSTLQTASSATTGLSSRLSREIKGLVSSELEQVLLKATRPDATPVKSKHVERLVGVTYQISTHYDIYDAVLRKLWKKMGESDARTTLKALYILHRFAADGSPRHAAALKQRLRELRRLPDGKKGGKYFASAVFSSKPAFVTRYAHYVLLRTQCFGGAFDEIYSTERPTPKQQSKRKSKQRPTAHLKSSNNPLCEEHYKAAELLLKAGTAVCRNLKDDDVDENTALAAERVASDLMALTVACGKALSSRSSSRTQSAPPPPALVRQWCVWYRDTLVPQTKQVLHQLSPPLDAFGLYLPSRIPKTGLTASALEEMIAAGENEAAAVAGESREDDDAEGGGEDDMEPKEDEEEEKEDIVEKRPTSASRKKVVVAEEEDAVDDDDDEAAEFEEEYEYEEEEYYDDDDEEDE